MDYEIFSVKVPKKDHNKPEIEKAKNTEIENLRTYESFEEVNEFHYNILSFFDQCKNCFIIAKNSYLHIWFYSGCISITI